jgi:hypothetical protein
MFTGWSITVLLLNDCLRCRLLRNETIVPVPHLAYLGLMKIIVLCVRVWIYPHALIFFNQQTDLHETWYKRYAPTY